MASGYYGSLPASGAPLRSASSAHPGRAARMHATANALTARPSAPTPLSAVDPPLPPELNHFAGMRILLEYARPSDHFLTLGKLKSLGAILVDHLTDAPDIIIRQQHTHTQSQQHQDDPTSDRVSATIWSWSRLQHELTTVLNSTLSRRLDLPPCRHPRIIIEDAEGRYQPIIKVFEPRKNMTISKDKSLNFSALQHTRPVIDWNAHGDGSPFVSECELSMPPLDAATIEKRAAAGAAAKKKEKEEHYCEICCETFRCSETDHLNTPKHQVRYRDPELWRGRQRLDDMIAAQEADDRMAAKFNDFPPHWSREQIEIAKARLFTLTVKEWPRKKLNWSEFMKGVEGFETIEEEEKKKGEQEQERDEEDDNKEVPSPDVVAASSSAAAATPMELDPVPEEKSRVSLNPSPLPLITAPPSSAATCIPSSTPIVVGPSSSSPPALITAPAADPNLTRPQTNAPTNTPTTITPPTPTATSTILPPSSTSVLDIAAREAMLQLNQRSASPSKRQRQKALKAQRQREEQERRQREAASAADQSPAGEGTPSAVADALMNDATPDPVSTPAPPPISAPLSPSIAAASTAAAATAASSLPFASPSAPILSPKRVLRSSPGSLGASRSAAICIDSPVRGVMVTAPISAPCEGERRRIHGGAREKESQQDEQEDRTVHAIIQSPTTRARAAKANASKGSPALQPLPKAAVSSPAPQQPPDAPLATASAPTPNAAAPRSSPRAHASTRAANASSASPSPSVDVSTPNQQQPKSKLQQPTTHTINTDTRESTKPVTTTNTTVVDSKKTTTPTTKATLTSPIQLRRSPRKSLPQPSTSSPMLLPAGSLSGLISPQRGTSTPKSTPKSTPTTRPATPPLVTSGASKFARRTRPTSSSSMTRSPAPRASTPKMQSRIAFEQLTNDSAPSPPPSHHALRSNRNQQITAPTMTDFQMVRSVRDGARFDALFAASANPTPTPVPIPAPAAAPESSSIATSTSAPTLPTVTTIATPANTDATTHRTTPRVEVSVSEATEAATVDVEIAATPSTHTTGVSAANGSSSAADEHADVHMADANAASIQAAQTSTAPASNDTPAAESDALPMDVDTPPVQTQVTTPSPPLKDTMDDTTPIPVEVSASPSTATVESLIEAPVSPVAVAPPPPPPRRPIRAPSPTYSVSSSSVVIVPSLPRALRQLQEYNNPSTSGFAGSPFGVADGFTRRAARQANATIQHNRTSTNTPNNGDTATKTKAKTNTTPNDTKPKSATKSATKKKGVAPDAPASGGASLSVATVQTVSPPFHARSGSNLSSIHAIGDFGEESPVIMASKASARPKGRMRGKSLDMRGVTDNDNNNNNTTIASINPTSITSSDAVDSAPSLPVSSLAPPSPVILDPRVEKELRRLSPYIHNSSSKSIINPFDSATRGRRRASGKLSMVFDTMPTTNNPSPSPHPTTTSTHPTPTPTKVKTPKTKATPRRSVAKTKPVTTKEVSNVQDEDVVDLTISDNHVEVKDQPLFSPASSSPSPSPSPSSSSLPTRMVSASPPALAARSHSDSADQRSSSPSDITTEVAPSIGAHEQITMEQNTATNADTQQAASAIPAQLPSVVEQTISIEPLVASTSAPCVSSSSPPVSVAPPSVVSDPPAPPPVRSASASSTASRVTPSRPPRKSAFEQEMAKLQAFLPTPASSRLSNPHNNPIIATNVVPKYGLTTSTTPARVPKESPKRTVTTTHTPSTSATPASPMRTPKAIAFPLTLPPYSPHQPILTLLTSTPTTAAAAAAAASTVAAPVPLLTPVGSSTTPAGAFFPPTPTALQTPMQTKAPLVNSRTTSVTKVELPSTPVTAPRQSRTGRVIRPTKHFDEYDSTHADGADSLGSFGGTPRSVGSASSSVVAVTGKRKLELVTPSSVKRTKHVPTSVSAINHHTGDELNTIDDQQTQPDAGTRSAQTKNHRKRKIVEEENEEHDDDDDDDLISPKRRTTQISKHVLLDSSSTPLSHPPTDSTPLKFEQNFNRDLHQQRARRCASKGVIILDTPQPTTRIHANTPTLAPMPITMTNAMHNDADDDAADREETTDTLIPNDTCTTLPFSPMAIPPSPPHTARQHKRAQLEDRFDAVAD